MLAQREAPTATERDQRLRVLLSTVRRALLMIVKGLDVFLAD